MDEAREILFRLHSGDDHVEFASPGEGNLRGRDSRCANRLLEPRRRVRRRDRPGPRDRAVRRGPRAPVRRPPAQLRRAALRQPPVPLLDRVLLDAVRVPVLGRQARGVGGAQGHGVAQAGEVARGLRFGVGRGVAGASSSSGRAVAQRGELARVVDPRLQEVVQGVGRGAREVAHAVAVLEALAEGGDVGERARESPAPCFVDDDAVGLRPRASGRRRRARRGGPRAVRPRRRRCRGTRRQPRGAARASRRGSPVVPRSRRAPGRRARVGESRDGFEQEVGALQARERAPVRQAQRRSGRARRVVLLHLRARARRDEAHVLDVEGVAREARDRLRVRAARRADDAREREFAREVRLALGERDEVFLGRHPGCERRQRAGAGRADHAVRGRLAELAVLRPDAEGDRTGRPVGRAGGRRRARLRARRRAPGRATGATSGARRRRRGARRGSTRARERWSRAKRTSASGRSRGRCAAGAARAPRRPVPSVPPCPGRRAACRCRRPPRAALRPRRLAAPRPRSRAPARARVARSRRRAPAEAVHEEQDLHRAPGPLVRRARARRSRTPASCISSKVGGRSSFRVEGVESRRVVDQRAERARQVVSASPGAKWTPCSPERHEFRHAAEARDDQRRARGERLEDHERRVLVPHAGHDEQVGARESTRDLVALQGPGQVRAASLRELAQALRELGLRRRAEDVELRALALFRRESRPGFQQHVRPLGGDQAAEEGDAQAVAARLALDAAEGVEVDAGRDVLDAIRGHAHSTKRSRRKADSWASK